MMPVGSTDRLVLGTLHLAAVPVSEARRIVLDYLDAGGEWLDTAPYYGLGRVEELLGDFLRDSPGRARLATKIGHFKEPHQYRASQVVRDAVGRSIDRLGCVPDVVSLHEGDWALWWSSGRQEAELVTTRVDPAESPAWCELLRMSEEYGFRIGITGNNATPLARVAAALCASVTLVARQYDLVWRNADDLLSSNAARSARTWLGGPFHQGALLNLPDLEAEALAAGDRALASAVASKRMLLERHGLQVREVAIPFLLADPRVSAVCVGVQSTRELSDAIAATNRSLDPDLITALRGNRIERPPRRGVGPRPSTEYCHASVATPVQATALPALDGGGNLR